MNYLSLFSGAGGEKIKNTYIRLRSLLAVRYGLRAPESGIPGVAYGVPDRVDCNRAGGNAHVPIVAATAFNHLMRISEWMKNGYLS